MWEKAKTTAKTTAAEPRVVGRGSDANWRSIVVKRETIMIIAFGPKEPWEANGPGTRRRTPMGNAWSNRWPAWDQSTLNEIKPTALS